MARNHFVTVLKNVRFNLLWGSQMLSIFCANMLVFALSYKLYTVTNRSLSISLLYVFYFLPVYLLGFFSGIIIDHVSRRQTLYLTNILQAVCVLGYLFIGSRIFLIYPIIFIYSLIDQFYLPAEAAYLPELVDKEDLPVANTFFSFASFGGLFFGFVMGGPIMRLLGVQAPFYLASVFLWLAALSAFLLPKDKAPKPFKLLTENLWTKTKENISENIKFIFSQPKVHFPLLIILFLMTIVSMLAVILPAFGKQVLNINFLDISWLIIIPIAVGAIFGAFVVNKKIRKIGKKKLITIGGFLSGLILTSVYFLSVNSKTSPFLIDNLLAIILILILVLGFGVSLVIIPAQTLLQETTPNEIRGRVFGIQKLLQGIFLIIPTIFAATMADVLGVEILFLIIGGLVLAGAILSMFYKNGHGLIFLKTKGALHEQL